MSYAKIADVLQADNNTPVVVRCMIAGKQRLPKKNSGEYLRLDLQDNTGKIIMPVWSDIRRIDNFHQVGDIILVHGKRTEFNDIPQITLDHIETVHEDLPMDMFIPTYYISEAIYDFFDSVVKKIKDTRYHQLLEQIIGLKTSPTERFTITDMSKWEAFTAAPAAVNHHGNKIGGLFLHTVGVLKALENIIDNYVENPFFLSASKEHLDTDMLRFLGILHDIDKTSEYKWDMEITRNEDLCVQHDVLFIRTLTEANLLCGKPFSLEEMSKMFAIILVHHGPYAKYQANEKDKTFLEATLLHCADMIDSQIIGVIESNPSS